jgi:hypothetical protein
MASTSKRPGSITILTVGLILLVAMGTRSRVSEVPRRGRSVRAEGRIDCRCSVRVLGDESPRRLLPR